MKTFLQFSLSTLLCLSLGLLHAQWNPPVTVATGYLASTSLAVVNGNPAISYMDALTSNLDLKYVQASDASGSTWNTPVTVDAMGDVGAWSSLVVVDGKPAISYNDATNGDLKYVQASDASGSTWNTPVTVDAMGDVGYHTSMAVVDGNPAISYYDFGNRDLKYVQASDASGSTWNTPVTVDATDQVGAWSSLAVVDGKPAISYSDATNGDLKYVQASDASGSSWNTPVTVDAPGAVGYYTSLAVVDGNPAISYYKTTGLNDLKYVRASDASGSSWNTPVTVDATNNVGKWTSLAVVNGKPAISYNDYTLYDLKYVEASDASGSNWNTPEIVDGNSSNSYSSLAEVNGNPAIGYIGSLNVKYVSNATPLPVELITFKGKKLEESIHLAWTTTSETNNAGFTLQHSPDGSTWSPLDFIAGKGTSSEITTYIYLHEKPLRSINYYCLQQEDFDGTIDFSKVISVMVSEGQDISIHPNPTKGTIHFTGIETGEIQIFNSIGSLVKVASLVNQEIDISDLSDGLYYLSFTDGNRVFSKRIVKH